MVYINNSYLNINFLYNYYFGFLLDIRLFSLDEIKVLIVVSLLIWEGFYFFYWLRIL